MQNFRPSIVGGRDRLWMMTQYLVVKTGLEADIAGKIVDMLVRNQTNMHRVQTLVAAGMSPSALNAFLVRFGFSNPDDRYVRRRKNVH